MKQVNRHNKMNPNNIWITANNRVYDVTRLLPYHPGGNNCILKKQGKDCTNDYVFHSREGRKLWVKYCIGYLQK